MTTLQKDWWFIPILGHIRRESTVRVLCRVTDIDPESGKDLCIDSEKVSKYLMLFIQGGEVLGFYNRCPHQGRAMNWAPDQFILDKLGQLVCPHHGACFKLSNGICTAGPCKGSFLESVETLVKDGKVLADI